jgi:hypothetical protein
MTTVNEPNTCVESISLIEDLEKRVALATVRLGEVQIRGVAVWRSKNGKLSVFFPSYKFGSSWGDAISLSEELDTKVQSDVIAAYKAAKSAAKKEDGKH